jgi:hypothetical protein
MMIQVAARATTMTQTLSPRLRLTDSEAAIMSHESSVIVIGSLNLKIGGLGPGANAQLESTGMAVRRAESSGESNFESDRYSGRLSLVLRT